MVPSLSARGKCIPRRDGINANAVANAKGSLNRAMDTLDLGLRPGESAEFGLLHE
ncbi:hypothetical protein [Nocardia sp. NPDC058666]|uniref:hypothetical protein n=1 Tax=unclassified Nocardia TaxID=2637762 RepID=UPI00364915C0